MSAHTADLLVRNGYVVTMDRERRVLTNGAVAIGGGSIMAVGPEQIGNARCQLRISIRASDE